MSCTLFLAIGLVCLVGAAKETKKCGLPDNYSSLPDFAQEELRAVWKNYVPGKNCDHELLITDDIMAVLEMFENEDNKGTLSGSTTSSRHPSTSIEKEDESDNKSVDQNHSEDLAASEEIPAENIPKTLVFPTLSPASSRSTLRKNQASRERTTARAESSSEEYTDETTTFSVPRRTTTSVRASSDESETSIEQTTASHVQTKKWQPKSKKFRTKRPHKLTTSEDDAFEENLQDIQGPQNVPDVEKLPFLKTASPEVIEEFLKVLNDNDIPSEERRQEELHLLAVSLLTTKQLQAYNAWSTNQRKRLREQQTNVRISEDARDALKTLSTLESSKQRDFVRTLPRSVRRELREYSTHALKRRSDKN